ncbi:molecular chaperone [Salmonella enterica subsp. enterica serovar Austin]|uniref:Molecular chaperone n=3 Tax=Salmonella enterica TaxID=28901 RepID=A0A624B3K8_SALMO|nr:molecular chaperone [Salmonella enterica]EBP3404456.1 molecular chaperone [Salmonella enterica subsp. enterica]EBZ5930487.1 molecular chaperone [Salmonella enterica subsp. enterica serovar Weslaco]ECZ5259965.1 molecular chaperone [Salmonella enterica subsp. enterica serovar Montevideo]EDH9623383.1 molecular chaperone [Salmonella enterica subsp. enterica serovar Austin]EDP9256626.1 molecular chaperone [Salmonella enterica subsp. enterica serovar Newmexico]
MKKITALALALLLGGWVSQSLAGGIVLERTRVIYDAGKKEAALPVTNRSKSLPYLLQSWVDNAQGTARGPFIITPPLFRLNAESDSSLRIIKSSENIANDKESLFFINVRAIPAKSQSVDANNNTLTLVFKTRIKIFYRPKNLIGKPYDAYKSLEYKYNNNKLDIYNPSAYHVVFAGLVLGKTDLTNKIDYIAPGEHKQLAVPTVAERTVQWAAINDYGGTTKTETRTLQ